MLLQAKIHSPQTGALALELDASMTIDELRETIQVFTGIPEDRQKLHFGSHIISPGQYAHDPRKTLQSFGVSSPLTIFVVHVRSPGSGPANLPRSLRRPHKSPTANLPKELLDLCIESLANNPEEIGNLLQSAPQARHLAKNPQFLKAMENPETLRDIFRSMVDPDARTGAMRNLELRMHQISNMGGESMIRSLFSEYLADSGEDSEELSQAESVASEEASQQRAFAVRHDVEPLPNPWDVGAIGTSASERALAQVFLPRPAHQSTDTADTETFSAQLRELRSMGFQDDAKNVAALRRSHGDVTGAVFILLSGKGNL